MELEKNRYLLKIKIEIGDFLGGEKAAAFVVLRETNKKETLELQEKWSDINCEYIELLEDEKAKAEAKGRTISKEKENGISFKKQNRILEVLCDLIPSMIIEHNFVNEDAKPATPGEVAELLNNKEDLSNYVVNEYYEKILVFTMPSTGKTETKAEDAKTV